MRACLMDAEGHPSAVGGLDELTPLKQKDASSFCFSWKFVGPGLLVCLADTDAGCLIVAAQTGAKLKYSLLALQVVLIPVLFLAQELTVRLGVYTKMGHTASIRRYFGPFWAWFACILLLVECVFAMMSEMSGIAGVAELWGLHRHIATMVAASTIIATVVLLNYKQIETLGIVLGLCELTFVVTMFMYRPDPIEVLKGSFSFGGDAAYFQLVAANIGAVIMPWMIYFQQSAIVARRLSTHQEMAEERAHTLLGSFLTQLIMIGAMVTMAAARSGSRDLKDVQDIVDVLSEKLGFTLARMLVSLGFVGGSLCASFVVSLAASWALCEALGSEDTYSLDRHPSQAPVFYGSFFAVVMLGVVVLMSGINVVKLNVWVELMNAMLQPLTVGFLFLLASGPALPAGARIVGVHKYLTCAVLVTCSSLSLVSAAWGLFA